MARPYRGKIAVDIRDLVQDWRPFLAPEAPAGAPNIVLLAWDDVGFATFDAFGGVVEAPATRRIAERGVRYSNFHTTALCSPTRASLLTGRNATACGMATVAELGAGFPGISTRVPFENGMIAEVLAEHGYNTYCIGKWHLTPGDECNLSAFKGRWPHHVFGEWADRYKGRFDMGYEAIRPGILRRQVELGILPAGTKLSPINPHGEPQATSPTGTAWPMLDTVRPWEALSDDERRLFCRMAEVFAGYVTYTDHQVGRVFDYLDESGELDNTVVVVISDNGASGEGGPNGSFNEWQFFNGVADSPDRIIPRIDELGGPTAYNHYNTGWAWAFDTPFPYWKRWAGYEGGVADTCIVSWPARIEPQRAVRHQYIHAVDVVPTIYELLGIEPPAALRGCPQNPIEGESFAASLTDGEAPGRETQFYAMLGQRSLYHKGWLACSVHPPLSGWGHFDADVWELYDLVHDRAQMNDVADQEPEHLAALKDLWFYYAGRYGGLPLDDRTAFEATLAERPRPGPPRDRYVLYPGLADVPELAVPPISGRSYTIAAAVDVASPDAEGVLFAHGGVAGGHSLYLKGHRVHYTFNWIGTHLQEVVADRDLAPGRHVVTAEFAADGHNGDASMPGATGTLTLYVDDDRVASDEIVTQPGMFCLVGDGVCAGRDSASPVTPDYRPPFRFTGGTIDKVVVDLSGERYVDHEAEVRGWFAKD